MQTEILQCLKRHGQRTDSEIAKETGVTLEEVRAILVNLAAQGEISQCSVTRFNGGEQNKGLLCRISGYTPPRSAGRPPRS